MTPRMPSGPATRAVRRGTRRAGVACVVVLVATAGLGSPAHSQRPPSFQGIGDLPGGEFQSYGFAVSADGSTVVGTSRSAFGDEAFRWTRAGGMQPLGGLESPNGLFNSGAYGVSADGNVVVGYSARGGSLAPNPRAFRWTPSAGMQSLGVLNHPDNDGDPNVASHANDISADGTVIVGGSGSP